MNVRLTPAASNDAGDAAIALDSRSDRLGDQFDVEMQRAITAIAESPWRYAITEDGPDEPETRQYFISRFQYRVIYAIWNDEAVIVAVCHARQRPGNWASRLSDLATPEDSP